MNATSFRLSGVEATASNQTDPTKGNAGIYIGGTNSLLLLGILSCAFNTYDASTAS